MSLYYLAGFSTEGTAQSMTATIAGNAATVASGTYAFATFASVMGTGEFTDFATAVKAAFDAAGGGPYTVTWSSTTYLFTISRATNFTLSFSSTSDLRLRAALGFTANLSGANSYTSTVRPYYVIVPAIDACTDVSGVYEPEEIVEEAVSDGGTPYGVSRQTTELYSDWTQAMESLSATFTRSATSAVPWTWQHFVRHVRGQYPFGKYETTVGNTCNKLRADAGSFRPFRVSADDDTYWSIRMLTRDLGALP